VEFIVIYNYYSSSITDNIFGKPIKKEIKKDYEWFEYKELRKNKFAIDRYKANLDTLSKTVIEGIIINIRKELKKIKGHKTIIFGEEMDRYLQAFEFKKFLMIKNTEFICNHNYNGFDYTIKESDKM
jgi:hypothetical protein